MPVCVPYIDNRRGVPPGDPKNVHSLAWSRWGSGQVGRTGRRSILDNCWIRGQVLPRCVVESFIEAQTLPVLFFVVVQAESDIAPSNSIALARLVKYFRIPRDAVAICIEEST